MKNCTISDIFCSVVDPDQGSGPFDPWIPDHISDSLETIFGLKILKFFDVDADPVSFRSWIRDPGWKNSDPGSGNKITDQQQ
jgi:hypothetical protein